MEQVDEISRTEKLIEENIKMLDEADVGGPHTVYLYYFNDSDGSLRIYEYFNFTRPVLLVSQKIDALAINACENGEQPSVLTDRADHLLMCRKSYLVFALESAADLDTNEPVTFRDINDPHNDGSRTFTYLDHKSMPVETTAGRRYINLIWYRNDIERKSGSTWEGVPGTRAVEQYEITLPFRTKMLEPGTGGTNLGPPVPPPSTYLALLADERRRLLG